MHTHHTAAENAMSKNVTLNHFEIEQLIGRAKMKRANDLNRLGAAAGAAIGSTLRAHRIAAVIAILVVSFGVKMFFFSAPRAEAEIGAYSTANMSILQMHIDHPNRDNLPAQKINDMTFVFVEPLP